MARAYHDKWLNMCFGWRKNMLKWIKNGEKGNEWISQYRIQKKHTCDNFEKNFMSISERLYS